MVFDATTKWHLRFYNLLTRRRPISRLVPADVCAARLDDIDLRVWGRNHIDAPSDESGESDSDQCKSVDGSGSDTESAACVVEVRLFMRRGIPSGCGFAVRE